MDEGKQLPNFLDPGFSLRYVRNDAMGVQSASDLSFLDNRIGINSPTPVAKTCKLLFLKIIITIEFCLTCRANPMAKICF